ncbi:LuxR C-terminal-related transcriptional regulator [Streptomyces alanosinicus]|uniref:Two-component system response regulator, LuxR family protein n=1 Tax=Streptomyces alanosinicus TaxID=68171 RepID=A0A918MIG1_9ACTN|nr:response regulator transcription factor [Streptomyces alanosinicus]GGW24238.1 putative two-component system response regulator, LuxR family protein [Streptomyces alanosinicus]
MRIMVIGDCPVFRDGITQLIDTVPDLHLVATASSIRGVDGELAGVDVVLIDLQQSVRSLAAAVAWLRDRGHAVIVVSSSPQIDAVQVIQAGASGYLSRQAEGEELLTAIRAVGAGHGYVSVPASHLLRRSPHFTKREQEILRLVAHGATDREIAGRLSISKHTVQSHLDRIGEKAGCRRRSQLTRLALKYGLIDGESELS